jgi:hypothetical protein
MRLPVNGISTLLLIAALSGSTLAGIIGIWLFSDAARGYGGAVPYQTTDVYTSFLVAGVMFFQWGAILLWLSARLAAPALTGAQSSSAASDPENMCQRIRIISSGLTAFSSVITLIIILHGSITLGGTPLYVLFPIFGALGVLTASAGIASSAIRGSESGSTRSAELGFWKE